MEVWGDQDRQRDTKRQAFRKMFYLIVMIKSTFWKSFEELLLYPDVQCGLWIKREIMVKKKKNTVYLCLQWNMKEVSCRYSLLSWINLYSVPVMNWHYTRIKQYTIGISMDWEDKLLAYFLCLNHIVLCRPVDHLSGIILLELKMSLRCWWDCERTGWKMVFR